MLRFLTCAFILLKQGKGNYQNVTLFKLKIQVNKVYLNFVQIILIEDPQLENPLLGSFIIPNKPVQVIP